MTDGQGAFWLTADRCDGTLAQVRQGTVSVRDLVKKKTVVVRARARLPGQEVLTAGLSYPRLVVGQVVR